MCKVNEVVAGDVRQAILTEYKSIRAFCLATKINYSRLSRTLKRNEPTAYTVEKVFTALGKEYEPFERILEYVHNTHYKDIGLSPRAVYNMREAQTVPAKHWEHFKAFF